MAQSFKTSSQKSRYHLGTFDLFAAIVAPILARLIRDPNLLSLDDPTATIVYILASAVITPIVFYRSGLNNMIHDYFDVGDLTRIFKICALSVLLATAVTFSVVRLDLIPRTLPFLHFMTLSGIIMLDRIGLVKSFVGKNSQNDAVRALGSKYVIVAGANHMTWLYAKMVRQFASSDVRIVGIVDIDSKLLGRSIAGHPIIGNLKDLPYLIDDYAIHGICISKIVMTTRDDEISVKQTEIITSIAAQNNIELKSLGHFLAEFPVNEEDCPLSVEADPWMEEVQSRPIWQFKRAFDIAIASVLFAVFAPIFLIVAIFVVVDIGSPILFWQHRVGKDGEWLRVVKFRTMASVRAEGKERKADDKRLSNIGRSLRASRLDELPQLWNILRGDMSIVGPRPLLPVDQPKSAAVRLCVKPGLTGWAQVNGGKMVGVDEKDALDEWYVFNATLALDLKIIVKTVIMMIRGEIRDEAAIEQALSNKSSARLPVSSAASLARRSLDISATSSRSFELHSEKVPNSHSINETEL